MSGRTDIITAASKTNGREDKWGRLECFNHAKSALANAEYKKRSRTPRAQCRQTIDCPGAGCLVLGVSSRWLYLIQICDASSLVLVDMLLNSTRICDLIFEAIVPNSVVTNVW
ncbi:hypothetical protein J6590_037667 [Homalodisca vitripennis]|nr:hypothetical protein J6590_037667 [Homalodisca vitripennis]